MSETDDMAARMRAARERLHGLPVTESHEPGPPDPTTGERWDRFNILGHTAEVLPFWSREIRKALDTGAKMGREPGSAGRLEGIESGRLFGEPVLRERIDAGTDQALALLATLSDADLDREVDTHGRGMITVRQALESFLVGHLEGHLAQLAELP
ncbi:MAG TPA: DinB family protein [Candidatus Dormibacteraeota bacterium]|nr:DinB family protein [Candidatus Dormibacteraeota bacterium]